MSQFSLVGRLKIRLLFLPVPERVSRLQRENRSELQSTRHHFFIWFAIRENYSNVVDRCYRCAPNVMNSAILKLESRRKRWSGVFLQTLKQKSSTWWYWNTKDSFRPTRKAHLQTYTKGSLTKVSLCTST